MLTERRDQFEQLVGDTQFGGGSPRPRGGDLLHLVDEQDQFVEFGEFGERLPQRGRQSAAAGGSKPGREQFDERPPEPG